MDIYSKRRHLGCTVCGHTFYGYYQKSGLYGVSTGKFVKSKRDPNVLTAVLFKDVFYPSCPNDRCGSYDVDEVKIARLCYEELLAAYEKKKKRAEERQAKKDAMPVIISDRLTYENKQAYEDRLSLLANNPDKMTKYEMMCDYFLDKLFWKKFGKGCHTMRVRNFKIEKKLDDQTYLSNSGKTRMGRFFPFFIVTNTDTGKEREIGLMLRSFMRKDIKPNRRNDPERNWGLHE